MAIAIALAASLCFGIALVTARVGLRALDARSGAAISIPTATVLFAVAAPLALDVSGFSVPAALLFALVGLLYPAVVTLVTFRSNELLGPTVTGAVSGTAPLFALLAAAALLGERVPPQATLAALGVVIGIALLSWQPAALERRFGAWTLAWPLAGALLRGLAQALAKAALVLWPNPFAASLIGYTVSSAAVIGADRLAGAARRTLTRRSAAWFALTGVLNGGAVLLMYIALTLAPVSIVAPIVAAYPLVTAALSALVLPEERMRATTLAGAAITVAAIAWLVASR